MARIRDESASLRHEPQRQIKIETETEISALAACYPASSGAVAMGEGHAQHTLWRVQLGVQRASAGVNAVGVISRPVCTGRFGTFQVPFPPDVASGLLLNPLSAAIESPGITLRR